MSADGPATEPISIQVSGAGVGTPGGDAFD
jgi:hypothetical protein